MEISYFTFIMTIVNIFLALSVKNTCLIIMCYFACCNYFRISSTKASPKGNKNLLDEKLAVTLDMAKVSDRNAALVLTPALQSLGHDPAEFNINRSSIRRQRIKCRQKIAANLKAEFRTGVPLTIHRDGKLLEDICSEEIVNRLPVLVSGVGVDQLLAVPKLLSGT